MTSSARPNLGGLFNGSTPAQRPSRIADPATPRPVSAVPMQPAEAGTADEVDPVNPGLGRQTGWPDPVNLVNQYFEFLRSVLDINQQLALACAGAMVTLPRRVGLHR
ncbi:MAG: hypothetical protein ABJD68_17740 [Nakamurella sp.]